MKYKAGDLIYYYDSDSENCESSIGTIIHSRMEKRFPNDPDGSEIMHYKIVWSDGWTDGNGDYIPEDVVDEYSNCLNVALDQE